MEVSGFATNDYRYWSRSKANISQGDASEHYRTNNAVEKEQSLGPFMESEEALNDRGALAKETKQTEKQMEEAKMSSKIVIQSDGSRVLEVVTQLGGMQSAMSIRLTEAADLSENVQQTALGAEQEEMECQLQE